MIIPEQPLQSQRDAEEDNLARAGFALVSAETMVRLEDVERRLSQGLPVSASECEDILYACYSGLLSEYCREAKVIA